MNISKDPIKTCHYCGSTIYFRSGYPHCSGDNLSELSVVFDNVLKLEKSNPDEFVRYMTNMQDTEDSFELFISYWNRKKKSDTAPLQCIHSEHEHLTVKQRKAESLKGPPMPDPFIPFPDLVEVYLAEVMLDRPLTELEKEGSRYIPKISEKGDVYYASLTWTTYPHGYMSVKDMIIKTDYEAPPAPKIFDLESIRGCCKGRAGDIFDE